MRANFAVSEAAGGGHFINVFSVTGHRVVPGFAAYAPSKPAVRAFSDGLQQQVKPYNIRTTVTSPDAASRIAEDHD